MTNSSPVLFISAFPSISLPGPGYGKLSFEGVGMAVQSLVGGQDFPWSFMKKKEICPGTKVGSAVSLKPGESSTDLLGLKINHTNTPEIPLKHNVNNNVTSACPLLVFNFGANVIQGKKKKKYIYIYFNTFSFPNET